MDSLTFSKKRLIIRQPDDWHLHLRDGDVLKSVITPSVTVFRRAVVMPNLAPPITTIQQALAYKERILDAVPDGISFSPLMTSYLTDQTSPQLLEEGFMKGVFFAAKLYPQNATTNSNLGVSDISKINSVLETMEMIGMPLMIHGEVTNSDVDVFDREAVFIEQHLEPLLNKFPKLKVVLEHITTETAVKYVEAKYPGLAATITPHHLHLNRNAMFIDGFRSDFYCLPIVKREKHRLALRSAATSGKPCFFLGTDSAPHLRADKQSSCGCAGIFNALNAIESYAQVFDEEGALEKLEAFSSEFGPKYYGLPLNKNKITLENSPHKVPSKFIVKSNRFESEYIVPFHSGETLSWRVSEKDRF